MAEKGAYLQQMAQSSAAPAELRGYYERFAELDRKKLWLSLIHI